MKSFIATYVLKTNITADIIVPIIPNTIWEIIEYFRLPLLIHHLKVIRSAMTKHINANIPVDSIIIFFTNLSDLDAEGNPSF